jgi:drug/metabolite transporter (DMT)-like permease
MQEAHPHSPAQLAPNVVGALWMLASAAAYTGMTTLVKYLGGDYSASLQTLYRQAAGLIILLPLMIRYGKAAFATSRMDLMLFRSGTSTTGVILSFYSFQTLPMADANALSFTRTLWIVPLAALFLRERIGPVRIAATLVGFLGVLLMVRPGGGIALGLPQLTALASSFLLALAVISIKRMATEKTETLPLLVWASVLGFVIAVPPALYDWRVPSWPDLALLGAMGALGVLTQTFYIQAMQVGEAAAMAPIDYIRLVMAIGAGLLLFGELPNPVTMAGAAVVVASTLFITWREHLAVKRRRSAVVTSDEPPLAS